MHRPQLGKHQFKAVPKAGEGGRGGREKKKEKSPAYNMVMMSVKLDDE